MGKESNGCVKCCVLIVLLVVKVRTNDHSEEDSHNTSSSVDSESKEIFNTTSKEKPLIERLRKKVMESAENNLFDNFTDYEDVRYKKISKDIDTNMRRSLSSFPFSVSIQKRSTHYATGALIDKKWILTAAELFYNVRESIKLYKARLGSVNCKRGGVVMHLKGIEIHPLYEFRAPSYDVALLRVAGSVDDTELIRPISLSSFVEKVLQAKFWTTYWPRLIVQGKMLPSIASERIKPNSMRISTQQLIPWGKCQRHLLHSNVTLVESTLCLEPIISHHSRCLVDPGAPIVADDSLWGVTSGWTSKDCSTRPSPTLFTRVSDPSVRMWIDTNVLRM